MNKKFSILIYIQLVAAVLFSVFSLSFNADISLLAFPISVIYSAIVVWFTFFKMFKPLDGKKIAVVNKLLQYIPYVFLVAFIIRRAGNEGTYLWYDIITVLLWCVIFVTSLMITHYFHPKRVAKLTENWNVKSPEPKKLKGIKKVGFEAVDWIDSFVQAVCLVLIVQIFTFQLYLIPSESMVPTFLVKDRVVVSKITSGPKFPLTEVGLPTISKYKRGDIVVLRNPNYSLDRKSEVKSVVSQLIYMLTFMTVNLNTDENGELKADPLVKRIVGVEGEQLVMQDGILYARTKESDEFKPVVQDEEYAAWNLNTLPAKIKQRVQTIPLSQNEYQEMLNFEEERRQFDLNVAQIQAEQLVQKFNKLAFDSSLAGTFAKPTSLSEFALFKDVQNLTRQLMNQSGGAKWFSDFMTSWIPAKNNVRDVYSEANYKMNVMTKITLGNLIVRYAELFRTGVSASLWQNDEILKQNMQQAKILNWYIQRLLDSRNMPVYPANDSNGNPQYLPKNCFFMMGDNRFNSLDMRHSYDSKLVPLTDQDDMSVEYHSIMEQKYIPRNRIVGKPFFRFWPLDRTSLLN